MNTPRHILGALLMAVLLLAGSGCSTTQSVDRPHTAMTVSQARKALIESLGQLKYHESVREVRLTRQRLTFAANNAASDRERIDVAVTFADLKDLTVETASDWSLLQANGKWLFFFKTESAAMKFVDAALTLKAAALAPDTEEADFEAFEIAARIWLITSPKPEMPDDARTYRALAKEALNRKDLPAALAAYREALDRYPMWPQGQYNAAQLAGEAEDYELAAHHMRRYLVLAPEASDAASAKDKYLLWEHKAAN